MNEESVKAWLKKSPTVVFIGPHAEGLGPEEHPHVFVDGGARLREEREGYAIGDGDSFSGAMDLRLSEQKDVSDFGYCLGLLTPGHKSVFLKGFLGERLDHTLCNLGEVHKFLSGRLGRSVLFDQSLLGRSQGRCSLVLKSTFSVLTLKDAHLKISGDCHYPTNTSIEPFSSLGLSNEGHGQVSIECDQPFFVWTDSLFQNELLSGF